MHAVRQEQLYACCCCLRYVHLNLLTAPFIWYNLPLGVVVNRLKMMLTCFLELVTMFLKLWFFYSVVMNEINRSKESDTSTASLNVGSGFLVLVALFMVAPHVLHIVWQNYTPGYSLRNQRRKRKAFLWSSIPFLRPIYECLWSSRFYQMFPYVTIRDQGWIVVDNGLHERFMTWRNLQVSSREIPIYILELYFLMQFFPFWKISDIYLLLDKVLNGTLFDSKENEAACWSLQINTNTIFVSFLLAW